MMESEILMKMARQLGIGVIVWVLSLSTTALCFSEDLALPGRAPGQASGSASDRPGHGGIASETEQAPIANHLGASEDQFLVSPHGPPHPKENESVAGQIAHKLVRGVANTVTGWVEIPKQVYLRTAGGLSVIGSLQGVVEGIGMSFARTTAGLYEITTFPVPLPIHYEPLFKPEYVWQDENNDPVD
jgi:putative exosortase-associated protein (TIGR04073 family)